MPVGVNSEADKPLISQVTFMEQQGFFNFDAIRNFFKEYFSLPHTREDEKLIIQSIRSGAEFKGATLWVLIFAIFVASLGLNVNSTAVIIGAMLISPLMGPIIGMGLALGTNDFDLLKRSFKNFSIATIFSVLTATLYFLITPLDTAQSEILARTSPTFYDVCIAFFGGLAGIVALGTKDKGNVIPGVAIATALMPPLCTAGFGLATGNWTYMAGALYLFFINTVFISLATLAGVRFMRFKKLSFVNAERGKYVSRYITVVILITVCPAIYLTYGIVKQTVYETSAKAFIEEELVFPDALILDQKIDYENKEIAVTLMGAKVSGESIDRARQRMSKYRNLEATTLAIVQGDNGATENVHALKSLVMEDFYKNSEAKLKEQRERIIDLESRLQKYESMEQMGSQVAKELQAIYPQMQSLALSKTMRVYADTTACDTVVVAVINSSSVPADSETVERIEQWMKARTDTRNIELVIKAE